MDIRKLFEQIWITDTEFYRPCGALPDPVCCVAALEIKSGREVRLWTEHGAPQPFDTGPNNLFRWAVQQRRVVSVHGLGLGCAGASDRYVCRRARHNQRQTWFKRPGRGQAGRSEKALWPNRLG